MSYSTKEITEKLDLSMHTLRYYEKEELLPPIARDKNGAREYSDLNLEQLILIRCMRSAGMSISYIKDYMNLCVEGPSSVSKRKEIILLQKNILEEQKKKLDENLEVINWKLKYYHKLKDKEPEEYANIIAEERATATYARMIKLLKE